MKRSLRSWLEIDFHIEMRTRELVERGLDERIAREMVLARLGDVRRLKRTCVDLGRKREREMRLTRLVEELRADVTSALRQMKASPGFTAVAAVTLALGIGANSAIFALADATVLRPLPFTAPHDRLVMVWERFPNGFLSQVSPPDFADWADQNQSFEMMAAFLSNSVAVIDPDGNAEQVTTQMVSARFFDLLGVAPIAGRTFAPSDAVSPSVVVLSEGFWRRRFGADPTLVGRSITVEGRPQTVIGVVPDRFRVVPATISNAGSEPPGLWTVFNYSRGDEPRFRAVLVGTFAALALGLAMVGVFGLLAYSVEQRVREFGVRIAMGAATPDVMYLVLGSAAKLALIGLVIGLTVAAFLSRYLTTLVYPVRPLDPITFVAVPVVVVVTAAIAVAAPAWRAARVDPVVAFRNE